MKNLILCCALILGGLQASSANANPYAPKLKSLVVVKDVFENQFSPFLYHKIMGEVIQINMDASCVRVQVNNESLVCISSTNRKTVVGKLNRNEGQFREWIAVSVNFYDNVKIFESRVMVSGRLSHQYRLVVTK